MKFIVGDYVRVTTEWRGFKDKVGTVYMVASDPIGYYVDFPDGQSAIFPATSLELLSADAELKVWSKQQEIGKLEAKTHLKGGGRTERKPYDGTQRIHRQGHGWKDNHKS